MSIYTRVKSYALRTGPYLYDMRFLLAGFAITYLGVSKIAAAGAKSKSLLSVSQRSTCGLNLVKLTQNDTKNLLIVPSYTDHPNHFFSLQSQLLGKEVWNLTLVHIVYVNFLFCLLYQMIKVSGRETVRNRHPHPLNFIHISQNASI